MDFICKLEFDFTSLLIEAVIGSLLALVILAGTIFLFVKRDRAGNQDNLAGVEAMQLSQAELQVLASHIATDSFENMQKIWSHDENLMQRNKICSICINEFNLDS